ncbi:hypothetical protein [Delftia acidovorans]|uniref:hypothetical protein n=1 Tax=Delftia acidovorans TaxID=80866 RepID=UPI0018E09F31|nr:hypothetical protein [Delftia acidovorans]
MPRIPDKTRAAFDILDILFFNQTCFLSFTEENHLLSLENTDYSELVSIYKVVNCVNNEVRKSGATGVAAEALKNTVYGLLEVVFCDNLVEKSRSGAMERINMPEKMRTQLAKQLEDIDPTTAELCHKYHKDFYSGVLLAIGKIAHNVCSSTALAIASKAESELQHAPACVKYRLTERVFSFEFPQAPLQFHSWMHRIEAVTSKKFVTSRIKTTIPESFQARAVLLCEFLLLRDSLPVPPPKANFRFIGINRMLEELETKLSETGRMQLVNEWKFYGNLKYTNERDSATKGIMQVDLTRLNESDYLHNFLCRFAARHKRSRFWTGSQHSWVGILGSGMIHLYHSIIDPQRKITHNGNNYSKSKQIIVKEDTVAQIICQNLSDQGFDSRPGSLYEAYRESFIKMPGGLFSRANNYIRIQNIFNIIYSIDMIDSTYYGHIVRNTPE